MECPQVSTDDYSSPFAGLIYEAARSNEQQQRSECLQRKEQARAVVADWENERNRRVAQVENARREAAAQAEAARREAEQKRQQELQLAAENSSDDVCATPDVARGLMDEFGKLSLFKLRGIEAIDISHLVTRPAVGSRVRLVCHGVFQTNNGLSLEGTMTLRSNVAGNAIVAWEMGR